MKTEFELTPDQLRIATSIIKAAAGANLEDVEIAFASVLAANLLSMAETEPAAAYQRAETFANMIMATVGGYIGGEFEPSFTSSGERP